MLSDSQRRHVVAFLARLEHTLDELERLATHPGSSHRLLDRELTDLPTRYDETARPDVVVLREEIRRLVDAFGLAPRERSRARQARALLGTALVQLEDTRPAALIAYGGVDRGDAATLDAALGTMRGRLERLLAWLSHAEPGSPRRESMRG
jgi:hypothetical protein